MEDRDGTPLVDYTSQKEGKRGGIHAMALDLENFRRFLLGLRPYNLNVMLEIKTRRRALSRTLVLLPIT